MGEWERRWRGLPHDKSLDELPKATVRFLDSLRVMVADTCTRRPGDVVAIRPGDDSEEDDDCDDWEGEDAHGARRVRPRARDARVVVQEFEGDGN